MKTVTLMNFVRSQKMYDMLPTPNSDWFECTKAEIELAKRMEVPCTFLLQYDALVCKEYQELFLNNRDDNMEIGLWYEIVQQLTQKAGIEWRSEREKNWDWHVVPGFSMAYTNEEREKLLDTAMNDFKEIYGHYPKTIASWQIDTHTLEYAYNKYNISAAAICRDQVNCDAYTLVGGYFNGAYYPSRKNIFTPAKTRENQIDVPVFRLLGPDPIHNYDNDKYLKNFTEKVPYTLEPGWPIARDKNIVKWFFDTYYVNEDLGFSYCQIGQENPFCNKDIIPPLRMQIELLKQQYKDVRFMKFSDAGEAFKVKFPKFTPATCVCALDDWDRGDEVQSVYYDCKNYTANLFRCENKIFIRALYLFDENYEDHYLNTPCQTWNATNENPPVIDTLCFENNAGGIIDTNGEKFDVEKLTDGVLKVYWQDKSVVFEEERIIISGNDFVVDTTGATAQISIDGNDVLYNYQGKEYALAANVKPELKGDKIQFTSEKKEIILTLKCF